MSDPTTLLELETRRRIYEHLRLFPGVHLRQAQRDLDMPLGTLEYHLRKMEKSGLVVAREDGRVKAFFLNEDLDRRDRDLLYYLRQEMPRRLALEITNQPGVTFKELESRMPIQASTLSFHLKKLRNAGLIEEQVGRSKSYTCTESERVRNLIVRYKASFLDDVVDRFAAAWIDLGPE